MEILDRKLKENISIEEIIAFFSNYKPKLLQLKISKSKINLETTSQEFTLEIGDVAKSELIDENPTIDQCANACNLTLNSFSMIENEKEDGNGDILFESTSVNNIPTTVSMEDVQTKQKGISKKETNANLKSMKKKRNIFDVLDVENLKKNIPFMHPDRKTHTFRFLSQFLSFPFPNRTLSSYFFDRVHEVCGSVGEKMTMTEKEILDVEQLRMGGSYLQEMKQLRGEGADIQEIEKYFLQKDFQMEMDERRRTAREILMKEKTDEVSQVVICELPDMDCFVVDENKTHPGNEKEALGCGNGIFLEVK